MTKTKLVLMNGFGIILKSMMLCNLKVLKILDRIQLLQANIFVSIHLHITQLVIFTCCDKSDLSYILTTSGK